MSSALLKCRKLSIENHCIFLNKALNCGFISTFIKHIIMCLQGRPWGYWENCLWVCGNKSKRGCYLCWGQIQPSPPCKLRSGSYPLEPKKVSNCSNIWRNIFQYDIFPKRHIPDKHCWLAIYRTFKEIYIEDIFPMRFPVLFNG